MVRTPTPPTYDNPEDFYPSRDARDLDDLLTILGATNPGIIQTLKVADNPGSDETQRIDAMLTQLGRLRSELDVCTRIIAEYSGRLSAFTLLETARRIDSSSATVSRWRARPMSIPKPE